MRIKTKGIIKKIALVLAGVVALSAVGFGVAKLVEFVKDDLKTISPVFDVGNLGTDGKFVDDESTLYTKEAFQCDGLQIKLDFDSQIEYQIYFYDDLDNFIESTEVLSAAYSETVHDGYARIVIMPTNDEDEKISFTERVTYPGQMTIKVAKEQNVEYYNVFNKRLRVVNSIFQLRFNPVTIREDENGSYYFDNSSNHSTTSFDLLKVEHSSAFSFTIPSNMEGSYFNVLGFKVEDGLCIITDDITIKTDLAELSEDTQYVIFEFVYMNIEGEYQVIPDDFHSNVKDLITISK